VGLLLSGPLIQQYGWPSVFYLFAVLGLFWCLFWPLVRPEVQDVVMQEPGANGSVDETSAGSGKYSTKHQDISGEVPWAEFFKSPPV
jgi:ACS family sodium-dependent inorganic phosphate cotransporter